MPLHLPAAVLDFLAEPAVAVLTTCRPDGSPHSAPVRFSWDSTSGLARVMTVVTSRKVRNLAARPAGRVSLCQVDGFRWATLEGRTSVSDDPARINEGVRRYTDRYRTAPPTPPGRVIIEITVERCIHLGF